MVDIKKLAAQAQERKTIYPTLQFSPNGEKHATVVAQVRFRDATFTVVPKPTAAAGEDKEFLTIHVDLMQPSSALSADGEKTLPNQQPGIYQIQCPAKSAGLTDGILKLQNAHEGSLMDVCATVETYTYSHPKHGVTRGYRVTEMPSIRTAKK